MILQGYAVPVAASSGVAKAQPGYLGCKNVNHTYTISPTPRRNLMAKNTTRLTLALK